MTAEITQADLDIAASFAGSFMFGPGKEKVLADWHTLMASEEGYAPPLAYLFAQHRIQARNAALAEAARVAEKIAEDAQSAWKDWEDVFDSGRKVGAEQVATAIRNLKTTPTESE